MAPSPSPRPGRVWLPGSALATLLAALRAWLPSLLLHASALAVLGLIAWRIGSDGEGEAGGEVAIVLRSQDEQGRTVYREQPDPVQSTTSPALSTPQLAGGMALSSDLPLVTESVGLGEAMGSGPALGEGADFAAQAGGSAASASFFGLRARGRDFVFVVDRSGSMDGAFIAAAKAELLRSLQALPRGARCHVLFFSNGDPSYIEAPAGQLVRAGRQQLAGLGEWIARVPVRGGTAPREALLRALALEPDAIWFLTDGLFDDRDVELVSAANLAEVPIHCVSFNPAGEKLLRSLARSNAGRYRLVDPRE